MPVAWRKAGERRKGRREGPPPLEKFSPNFLPTSKTSRILLSAACLWERVCTANIQASVALEYRPLGCAGHLRSSVSSCCSRFQNIGSDGPGADSRENAGGAWLRVKY